MENDLKISELKEMQLKLYELNKEKWNDMEPKFAKNHILYMIEEIGECISIIKKKKIDSVMNDEHIRNRFIEELCPCCIFYGTTITYIYLLFRSIWCKYI